MKWNYDIYSVDEPTEKQKGSADLIEFERLLPIELYTIVREFGQIDTVFKLELIVDLQVYKIWK